MPSPGFSSVGMQLLSSLAQFLGITVLTHCISRRLAGERLSSLSDLVNIPWPRLCLVLVLLDSWLFVFSSGILTFGVGLDLSASVCSVAIDLCIAFYATSKILVYFYLIGLYAVVIALMIAGRISLLRSGDDAASLIGLTTSTVNIGVLAILQGHELGWICLASCGVDVTLNSYALFWATGLKSRRQNRLSARELNTFATQQSSISTFVSPNLSPSLQLPQATRPSCRHLPHLSHIPHMSYLPHPFATPVFEPKSPQSEVSISANPELAEKVPSFSLFRSITGLFRDEPTAASMDNQVEVTITTKLVVEHEDAGCSIS
ncbi:hypothetical protein BT96DRAFT_1005672 [Gymnopus androsaceus JB14]|uniref:Uncharacterized protein n=1 Tax=Gymnopus androsaceus JB14 TaxID=1447944 RepID=A0A6A4GM46_9AGAR|nr:hypothetical protein BT96DRAFT_1005672 [Gymnopus androsaceus JB14]